MSEPMQTVSLCDGKYTIRLQGNKPFLFDCLRHGEPWRDLVGDNMVMAMFQEIVNLREKENELKTELLSTTKDLLQMVKELNGDTLPDDDDLINNARELLRKLKT